MRQVEWIGVKSPLQDAEVWYRKITGVYNDDECVLLEAVAKLVAPYIRQPRSTARGKGKADGYSKEYLWGPVDYIQLMPDIDADRLFRHDPDEYEFRDLDNPAHDNRVPIVPWPYITAMMHRILQEAANGPKVVEVGKTQASQTPQIDKLINSWVANRTAQAKERGMELDRELRIVKR